MKEKEKRRGRGRRRREEEEEGIKPKRYGTWIFGMETTLSMDFVWITWILYGILEKFMTSKSRVC